VVTGIPMEFPFDTNWARLSRYSGGSSDRPWRMAGMFAFLLESAFVGVLGCGDQRPSPRQHLTAAVAVALGSWLSGYFTRGR